MSKHLSVVRRLLDRESESAADTRILTVDSPALLREILVEETDLPHCLRQAMESPSLWSELSMNGREVWMFRMFVRIFGRMDLEQLRQFLSLARQAQRTTPAHGSEYPAAGDVRSADPSGFGDAELS
jgi:hypothetical protein